MNKQETLDFVYENDVKFIRLQFCDIFGSIKNISIMPAQLERAFTRGIGFDASLIPGFFEKPEGELFLVPDPDTMRVLPWRPQQGRVIRFLCGVQDEEGQPFYGDSRALLKRVQKKADALGMEIIFGPECEFYLFATDDAGAPVLKPHDEAGYFDVAPNDRGENVRREICLTLEDMGMRVESSHHELGDGQHQITFHYDAATASADNFATFKTVVKTIALRNGLYASFMPKPLNGNCGSGLHINISLHKDGKNLITKEGLTGTAAAFLAGILNRIQEITLFLNPLVNSYKRIGGGFEAPGNISWSLRNRAQLVRIPTLSENARMELRSPDPSCNPYLAFSLLIEAGLLGVRQKEALPPEQALCGRLPGTLAEAIAAAKESVFAKEVLGDHIYQNFLSAKEEEWKRYSSFVDTWELNTYLKQI